MLEYYPEENCSKQTQKTHNRRITQPFMVAVPHLFVFFVRLRATNACNHPAMVS